MASKKGLLFGGLAAALLFGCLGGCGLIGYFVWSVTGEAVKAGDEFLALLGDGKVDEAYDVAASGMRRRLSRAEFAASVKQMGLTDHSSASWPSRSVKNEEATLEGTITTRSGGTIPMKMTLVKESGRWRVLTLGGAPAGAGVKKPVPTDDEARKLATATLLDFDRAVKANDFTAFHRKTSTSFQSQKTPAELQEVFGEFVKKKIDLESIKDVAPVLDNPPGLDGDELLILSGHYPTRPSQVKFRLKYSYEHPDWKLSSISVNVGE